MKMDRNLIIITSTLIAVLAVIVSATGLLWPDLYKDGSQFLRAEATGQDLVTLALCVPMLLASGYYAARGSLRGRLAWTGAVFYFLYCYATYTFMAPYNQFFLVYVALFSLSLYTFSASLLTLDLAQIKNSMSGKAPVKTLACFSIVMPSVMAVIWLDMIVGSLLTGSPPERLGSSTTLIVQALDLGVLLPFSALTGILLLRGKPWGYALAPVVLVKIILLGVAILAMIAFTAISGVPHGIGETIFMIILTAGGLALGVAFYSSLCNAPDQGNYKRETVSSG